jgi:hypothetical protein
MVKANFKFLKRNNNSSGLDTKNHDLNFETNINSN